MIKPKSESAPPRGHGKGTAQLERRLAFLAPSCFGVVFGGMLLLGQGSQEALDALGPAAQRATGGALLVVAGAVGLLWTLRTVRLASWWGNGPRSWPWSLRVLAVSLLGVSVYASSLEMGELRRITTRTTDFGTIFGAAQALASGGNAYTLPAGDYFYPPILAALMSPFRAMPVAWASVLWFAFKLWLLSRAFGWIAAMLPLDRFSASTRPWVILGLVAGCGRFWLADLQYGNTNIVVMSLVVCGLLCELRGQSRRAGIALGIAAAIKVVPIVVAAWLLGRNSWRSLAWMSVSIALLALTPLFTRTGLPAAWHSYWEYGTVAKLGEDLSQVDNQSLLGASSRLPWSPRSARASWLASSALLGLLVLFAGRRSRQLEFAGAAASAALCPALILAVSPGSWVVHYVMAALPMAMVLAHGYAGSKQRILIAIFWAANFAFTMSGWSRATVRWSTHHSWYLLALLALFGGCLWLALRSRATRTDSAQSHDATP